MTVEAILEKALQLPGSLGILILGPQPPVIRKPSVCGEARSMCSGGQIQLRT